MLMSLNRLLARAATAVSATLLLGVVAVVLLSVFFRYVVNSSLSWGEELTRYLAAWLVFTGMAPAYRAGEHVRIGVLVDRFSERSRRVLYVASEVLVLVLVSAIAWEAAHLTIANFTRDQVTPGLRIPIAWVYLAIPVGMGLMALQSLERLVRLFVDRRLLDPEAELVTGQPAPPVS